MLKVAAYVYLIQEDDLYKIGFSRNPENRVKQVSSGGVILHTFTTENARYYEAELHRRFALKRVYGEWFRLTQEDVALIMAMPDHVPRDKFKTGTIFPNGLGSPAGRIAGEDVETTSDEQRPSPDELGVRLIVLPKMMKLKDVCNMLGCSHDTLLRLRKKGTFPAPFNPGGRLMRWSPIDITAWATKACLP